MAASRMTVANGTLFHTLITQSDTIAQRGSTSQGIGSIPTQPSMMLSRPLSVLNTNCHTTAITTAETASGMNTMVRNTPIPASLRLSAAATTTLITTVGLTVPRVNTTVLRTAMTNSGSAVNKVRKLSQPTNSGGLNRSQRCTLI